MTRHCSAITVLLTVLVGTVACDDSDRSRARPHESPASAIGAENAQPLAIGAILRTSITGDEPLICAHVEGGSRADGPCQRFRLRTPEAGILLIHVAWDNQHLLGLRLRTHEGGAESASCCRSPIDLRARIDAGAVYEIDVILLTEWGAADRQSFELTASVQRNVS
jgi:hypothetical protein